MEILNSEIDLHSFFQELERNASRALLLDYDGTLAPFQMQRDKAFPYPGVRDILNKILNARHSLLVIISGRCTRDLVPLLGLKSQPELWGSHGVERLKPDGKYELAELDARALSTLENAAKWIQEEGLIEHGEQKPGALAFHWRGLSDEQTNEIRYKIISNWAERVKEAGLSLLEFDGGIEFRVHGRNKGYAVQTILTEMGNNSVAAYLGDDITDEDAFRAIKSAGPGILVRPEFRPTEADLWLSPPVELIDFLSEWHKHAGNDDSDNLPYPVSDNNRERDHV